MTSSCQCSLQEPALSSPSAATKGQTLSAIRECDVIPMYRKKRGNLKHLLSFSGNFSYSCIPSCAARKLPAASSAHTAHAPIDGKDGERESHEDSRKDSLVFQGKDLIRQASRVHANAENGAEKNADAAQKEVGVECLTERTLFLRRCLPFHQQAEKTSGFS